MAGTLSTGPAPRGDLIPEHGRLDEASGGAASTQPASVPSATAAP